MSSLVISRLAFITAMLAASPALAQEEPDSAPQTSAETSRDSEDTIIVTARKREERAVDVPIALTAVSGEALELRV